MFSKVFIRTLFFMLFSLYFTAFSQPPAVNDCKTATFYIHYVPPPGQKFSLISLQTRSDSKFVLTGNIFSTSAGRAGYIGLISNAGSILSGSVFAVNGRPTLITGSKILADDKLLVTGVVSDGVEKSFIGLLNPDLSVIWLKTFETPALPVKAFGDNLSNDKFLLAVQQAASVSYFVLNIDGSLVLNFQVAPAGFVEIAGVGHTGYGEFSIVNNCLISGNSVTEITRFSQVTGAVLSTHTLGSGNESYRFYNTVSYANRVVIAGVAKDNSSGQYFIRRNMFYNTDRTETQHSFSLPGGVGFNSACFLDNDAGAMGVSVPQDGKLFFIKQFAAYQTEVEHIRSYNVPISSSLSAVTRSLTDGGYLFGLNTADSSECVLLKTDSTGILPGCGYNDVAPVYLETLNVQNSAAGEVLSAFISPPIAASSSINPLSFTGPADCAQTFCPPPPQADPCLSSYFKTLRSNSFLDMFGGYGFMGNNRQLIATTRTDQLAAASAVTTNGVKLFDEQANFIKGKNFYYNGKSDALYFKKTDAHHALLVSYLSSPAPTYGFTLIDDDLNVIWTKSYQTFSGFNYFSGGLTFPEITSDADGNIYMITNTLGFQQNSNVLVFKMDPSGNPLWLKVYAVANSNLYMACSTTTNSSLIILIEGSPGYGATTLRLDKTTGQMLNAYKLNNYFDGSLFRRSLNFYNDRLIYAGTDRNSKFLMGTLDTLGQPIRFSMIAGSSPGTTAFKAGQLYALFPHYANGIQTETLFKTDTTLIPAFIKDYNMVPGLPTGIISSMIDIGGSGSIYRSGNYGHGGINEPYFDPLIKKYDPDGSLGTCAGSANPVITPVSITSTPITFSLVNTAAFTQVNYNMISVPDTMGQQVDHILCSSTNTCSSVSVSGPANICGLFQPVNFHAQRNPGCNITPDWVYDTAYAVLQSAASPDAVFTFKQTGDTWIKVIINAGCNSYKDSIPVHIESAPAMFTLGVDRSLCPGDTIILNAGPGFSTYTWQNGSHHLSDTVTVAGQYFVEVANSCGNIYRDTINIFPAVVPALTLGPDRQICIGDTFHIAASPGFSGYQWQSTTNVYGTGQAVYIVPLYNESVSVTAITPDGCKVRDTVNTISISAHAVSLGNDVSFCTADSATFMPQGSYLQYTSYLWNNGSTSDHITVHAPGLYWIRAMDTNGCAALDTVKVLSLLPLPQPALGADFNLCTGQSKILDAGPYDQFLWQDGTTGRYFTSTTPGLYTVTVTAANGCKAIASVRLNNIFPLPANFLNEKDSVCFITPLTIHPLSVFSDYLWSTGEILPSIIVKTPGLFTLKVKDLNGCEGSDTIKIYPKDCIYGVYIPTAFTPNADGINDRFRVNIYIPFSNFRLEIYNRYGQNIYTSTDPAKGWDGTFKNEAQPAGAYIYKCSYNLAGEIYEYKNGTILLLR